MNRILIIRGGAIGDFVLTLPALRLLREAYPDARLEILGYPHIAALAENRFYAQGVRSIEHGSLAGFFAKGAELPREWTEYFPSFDLVVSYLVDPEGIFEENVRRCGIRKILVGSPKITGPEHATEQLAQPLAQLGLELTDPAATLYPSAADRKFAITFSRTLADPLMALHPGSGSQAKNWPIEQWLKLAEELLRTERAGALLVLGGEADQSQLDAFRSVAKNRAIRFAENVPLPELAALLERCACFLGHDSGISHIAAAVGTPSVLLFGPTDPAVWAPRNKNVRVLRAHRGSMRDVPQNEVRAELAALIRERVLTSQEIQG